MSRKLDVQDDRKVNVRYIECLGGKRGRIIFSPNNKHKNGCFIKYLVRQPFYFSRRASRYSDIDAAKREASSF